MSGKVALQKYNAMPVQVRTTFWFLICSFLQKGISFLTTPIFTRIMSTKEYGQFNVFMAWYGIIAIFVSLNLSYGVYSQGLIKYSDDRWRFSSSMQGLSLVLCSFWFLIYLVSIDFWNHLFNLSTVQMLALFIMIWSSAVFAFWATEQRVEYKYRALVTITLVVSVLQSVLGIIAVKLSTDKATARILCIVAIDLLIYFFLFIAQMKNGRCFFSWKYWRHALLFNLPLIPHYLSQTVLNNSDRIMIDKMVGSSEAGIYSLAYSIAIIMMLFNNALSQTINPWMYTKIKAGKNKELASVAYSTLVFVAFVNLALIAMAPDAVRLFAREEYYEAIWAIPPIAMSVFFIYSYDLFAKHAFYFEKTGLIMITSVVGAVANIILNYIFIQIFGYIAAGYTTLLCYIIYAMGHYILMIRVCKKQSIKELPYETNKILGITFIFLLCGFVLMGTYSMPLLRYSIIIFTFLMLIAFRERIIITIRNIIGLRNI